MQVKKEAVAEALRTAAADLFAREGWEGTTMSAVARGAGVSAGTAYVYFPSKFALLLAVYEPWLREGVEALRRDVRRARTADARLRRLVRGLLHDLPRDRGAFAATVMAAIGGVETRDYAPDLGRWLEAEVTSLLEECLGPGRDRGARERRAQARLLLLAFDGAALRSRFAAHDDDAAVRALILLLRGETRRGA